MSEVVNARIQYPHVAEAKMKLYESVRQHETGMEVCDSSEKCQPF